MPMLSPMPLSFGFFGVTPDPAETPFAKTPFSQFREEALEKADLIQTLGRHFRQNTVKPSVHGLFSQGQYNLFEFFLMIEEHLGYKYTCWPATLRECVGYFPIIWKDFASDFPGGFILPLSPHKMRGRKPAAQSAENPDSREGKHSFENPCP